MYAQALKTNLNHNSLNSLYFWASFFFYIILSKQNQPEKRNNNRLVGSFVQCALFVRCDYCLRACMIVCACVLYVNVRLSSVAWLLLWRARGPEVLLNETLIFICTCNNS